MLREQMLPIERERPRRPCPAPPRNAGFMRLLGEQPDRLGDLAVSAGSLEPANDSRDRAVLGRVWVNPAVGRRPQFMVAREGVWGRRPRRRMRLGCPAVLERTDPAILTGFPQDRAFGARVRDLSVDGPLPYGADFPRVVVGRALDPVFPDRPSSRPRVPVCDRTANQEALLAPVAVGADVARASRKTSSETLRSQENVVSFIALPPLGKAQISTA
jgi:hypothetical protein